MLTVGAFLTSFITSLIIFIVLAGAFVILVRRPSFTVIFFPKRILAHEGPPEEKELGAFEWAVKAFNATEDDIARASGLDCAVYIRFLRACLEIVLFSSIYCVPVLIPLCATSSFYSTWNAEHSDPSQQVVYTSLDTLAMGNIPAGSSYLWAFLVGAYWLSIVCWVTLYRSYIAVTALRNRLRASDQSLQPAEFAVLLRDVPGKPPSDHKEEDSDKTPAAGGKGNDDVEATAAEATQATGGSEHPSGVRSAPVDAFFGRVYGDKYIGSWVFPPLSVPNALNTKLDAARRSLLRIQAVIATNKAIVEDPDASEKAKKKAGERPQHRTGFLGLFGDKVDSEEFYTKEIGKLKGELGNEQHFVTTGERVGGAGAKKEVEEEEDEVEGSNTKKGFMPLCGGKKGETKQLPGGAGIAFFSDRVTAAMACQSMHVDDATKWTVQQAPEPSDVVWNNLGVPTEQRWIRMAGVYILVFFTICFYMIPISFISSLTTINNLEKTLPFLAPLLNYPAITAIVQAFLPQLALIIFLAILPLLLTILSSIEGIPSSSHIERAASGKYFYFIVFNVFIGTTLSSSLFQSLQQIVDKPTVVINLLGSSLPQAATFFISFISLKYFISLGLEISRVVPVVIFVLKRRFLAKTQADLNDAWKPPSPSYLDLVPNDLLTAVLSVCYAVIAPLILPFAAVNFFLSYLIYKNQFLRVYVPEYESRGRFWPHMHARIIGGLILAQITMLGYFGIKQFPYTVILIPLPIITLIYYVYTLVRLYPSFRNPSLDMASRAGAPPPPSRDDLMAAFLPPSLSKDALEGVTREELELPGAPLISAQ